MTTAETTKALDNLIGASAWMRQLRESIARVARFRTSVLIVGPTGTGKELIARSLHSCSPREPKPFIPVNCAAVSQHLFASHMFGHVKGAFTGAHYEATGCFRAADGGTVFLDEIGELELDLQAKLLRVLQERVVVPVGAHEGHPVDVRVIAATNRDLERDVAEGRFRSDLLFRLNVVTIRTRPLRERKQDIPVLAEHCLLDLAEQHGMPKHSLTQDAVQWLLEYDWPGNVRQLQNVLERAAIFSDDGLIDAELLSASAVETVALETNPADEDRGLGFPHEAKGSAFPDSTDRALQLSDREQILARALTSLRSRRGDWLKLADLERMLIAHTLKETYYNQTAAADLLGISYRALARKIKHHGIDTSRSRRGRPRKRG